jgi:hypothetical protein
VRALLATAPSWLSVSNVKNIAIGAMAGFGGLVFIVMRFVHKIMLKVGMAVVLVALGIGSYAQRANLNDCAQKCKCTVFGQDLKLTGSEAQICQATGKSSSIRLPSIG